MISALRVDGSILASLAKLLQCGDLAIQTGYVLGNKQYKSDILSTFYRKYL